MNTIQQEFETLFSVADWAGYHGREEMFARMLLLLLLF
jgi:hypothetical protein